MKRRNNQTAKKFVFEPFKNPYENNIYLDSESICSEVDTYSPDALDIDGLLDCKRELEENISDWETIMDIDLSDYRNSGFTNEGVRENLQSDRRTVQTLKVELREINRRIRMMMNTNEREHTAA